MKHRALIAIGALAFASGCVVSPAPTLETGSVSRPPPAQAPIAIQHGNAALAGEVANLRRQVGSMTANLERLTADIETHSTTANRPAVVQLKADVARLNSVIAKLQSDVAETRNQLEASVASARDRGSKHSQSTVEIAALRRQIDRTNTLLLEVASSLAGRTFDANTAPVKASVSR